MWRKGSHHSLVARQKMSEAKRGEKNPNWGKHLSPEHRRKISDALKGEKNPSWRGGRRHSKGYIMIYAPDHPCAQSTGHVFEHRLIMEKHLGRYLEPWELVHHRNGTKDDNRVENLELLPKAKHRLITMDTNAQIAALKDQIAALKDKVRKWQEAYFKLLTTASASVPWQTAAGIPWQYDFQGYENAENLGYDII